MSSQHSIIDILNLKVSPQVLAGILGVNVSLLYQESQIGRLPAVLTEATYLECIQQYINYFKKNADLKILKEKNEQELRIKKQESKSYKNTDVSSLHPLMEKKIIQEIKVNRVKEVQGWLKVAEEKKSFIISDEFYSLCEPFLFVIKNILVAISVDYPETREKIDEGLNNLYVLGRKMLEQVKEDEAEFVQEMLDRDIDNESLNLKFVPEDREII